MYEYFMDTAVSILLEHSFQIDKSSVRQKNVVNRMLDILKVLETYSCLLLRVIPFFFLFLWYPFFGSITFNVVWISGLFSLISCFTFQLLIDFRRRAKRTSKMAGIRYDVIREQMEVLVIRVIEKKINGLVMWDCFETKDYQRKLQMELGWPREEMMMMIISHGTTVH